MLDLLGALDYCHEHWVSSANISANISAYISAYISEYISANISANIAQVLHRDIKTSNMLVARGLVCLCDFGLARMYGEPLKVTLSPTCVCSALHILR